MSRAFRVFQRARSDTHRIIAWLSQRSPQGALRWESVLIQSLHRIASDPDSFAEATDAPLHWNRSLRQCLFKTPHGKKYRIIFEVTAAEVRILRVRGPGQPPLRRRDLPDG